MGGHLDSEPQLRRCRLADGGREAIYVNEAPPVAALHHQHAHHRRGYSHGRSPKAVVCAGVEKGRGGPTEGIGGCAQQRRRTDRRRVGTGVGGLGGPMALAGEGGAG